MIDFINACILSCIYFLLKYIISIREKKLQQPTSYNWSLFSFYSKAYYFVSRFLKTPGPVHIFFVGSKACTQLQCPGRRGRTVQGGVSFRLHGQIRRRVLLPPGFHICLSHRDHRLFRQN